MGKDNVPFHTVGLTIQLPFLTEDLFFLLLLNELTNATLTIVINLSLTLKLELICIR